MAKKELGRSDLAVDISKAGDCLVILYLPAMTFSRRTFSVL